MSASLFLLVGNPICCCGVGSEADGATPRCCQPMGSDTGEMPKSPRDPGENGCEGCLCGEDIANPNEEAMRGVPCRESGNLELGFQEEFLGLRGSIQANGSLLIAAIIGCHCTGVPIYKRHCAYLI